MKILIIGGTSSLGTALKAGLIDGNEVITAGRKNCDIILDLGNAKLNIDLPENIDVIIHTAAHFGGTTATDMIEAEMVNVIGTLNLCDIAVRAGARHFILISSMSACVKEGEPYYSIYSISKKHAEEAARHFCTLHSMPLTILRPSQIYGNGEGFRLHQPFIYTMIDKAEKGEEVTIYGSNDAMRNYIHVDDLINIIKKVIENKVEGVYPCMYASDQTYSQVARAAYKAFDKAPKIMFLTDKADIPDNIFDKEDALYKKIDFYPRISIEEGMKKIATYRKALL